MAIVVKTQPGTYQSVHGDLIYVVHEATKANDPVTYPDYRYLADVYAAGVLVTRLKAYPDPITKMGIFNLGNIFRNYVTPVFNPTANVMVSQIMDIGDWNVSGTVVFGEEYGFTQFPATIAGVGQKFYGHYNGRLLGTLTNLSAYLDGVASARPLRSPVNRNDLNNFLPYFKDTNNIDFTIQGQPSGLGVTDAVTGNNGKLHVFNFSPTVINATYGAWIQPTDTWFTVTFENPERIYRFDLMCEPKYTNYTLHFLNRFGGFESRDFTKLSRKVLDIEKKDFGKLPYTVNASGEVSYYNSNNVYNETRTVYASQYKEKMTLNTDILTDSEYRWLGDLILSPMVYIEMDGYFIPIVISQNNYEFRKAVNDKTSNLTIEIIFGDQFNAQYR